MYVAYFSLYSNRLFHLFKCLFFLYFCCWCCCWRKIAFRCCVGFCHTTMQIVILLCIFKFLFFFSCICLPLKAQWLKKKKIYLSSSLRYLIYSVTKVPWGMVIWCIVFLQVNFWKIGFWQICHFVNWLFDLFVI